MNNCIKLNRTIYCKVKNKEIRLSECSCCEFKEYKSRDYTKSLKSNIQMKNKSSKLTKLERDRFSLFTDDLEHCIVCGKDKINKHEIFYGSGNRQKSMQYGLVIPLCTNEHHNQVECKEYILIQNHKMNDIKKDKLNLKKFILI